MMDRQNSRSGAAPLPSSRRLQWNVRMPAGQATSS